MENTSTTTKTLFKSIRQIKQKTRQVSWSVDSSGCVYYHGTHDTPPHTYTQPQAAQAAN